MTSSDLPLADGVWSVDPERSEIGFAVSDMWGLRVVRGSFRAYDGSLTVRAGGAAGRMTIEAASIDTGHARRDRHLRSPAFFDVDRHPRIVFAGTAAPATDGDLTVTGELTIGSSRAPLELPVRVEHTGNGTVRLEGETTLARETAGLAWNRLGMIRGDARLHAALTLERSAL